MEASHGFFADRRQLEVSASDGRNKRYADCKNVTNIISTLVSHRMATLHELDTVYGTQDAYDMLEILIVDSHNRNIANAHDNR